MRPNKDRQNLWLWAALLLPLLWLAAGLAQITEQAHGLSALAAGLTALLNDPLNLRWCSSTPKFLLAVLVLYPLGVYCYLLDQADRRPGEEHGSAHWGIAKELNERYRNRKDPWQEIILSQNIRLSNDSYRHQRNLHVVVIGGSGSGKTRFFVKPNALQCSGSYFFLDPKGELTYSLGGAMEENGVTVTVIDFVHFRGHYNPVAYLKTDEDAMKLAYALVFNTKKNPAASGGENEFWDKSAVMFLASLILYILYESPLYERNLNTMMQVMTNRRKDATAATWIYFDEIHVLLKDPMSSNFLYSSWKRFRKYNAYATGISQDIQDYLDNPVAYALLSNSEFVIMLRQSKSLEALERLYGLSKPQLEFLRNASEGHGIIKMGNSMIPFSNLEPKDTAVYKLITTKPGEATAEK